MIFLLEDIRQTILMDIEDTSISSNATRQLDLSAATMNADLGFYKPRLSCVRWSRTRKFKANKEATDW
jgi:hypothetical protein